MSLRLFADHCVANTIVESLRGAGHEILRLRDFLPCDAADQRVIERAQQLGTILLSLNGDFADVVATRPRSTEASSPSGFETTLRLRH